jgi:YYY domain-containing protein
MTEKQKTSRALPRPLTTLMRRDNLIALALVILAVIVGWYFRSVGRNWDDYVHFHPDERFMTGSVGINIGRGWLSFSDGNEAEQEAYCRAQYPDTNGVGGYFDARCSDFNPHNVGQGFYVYGTLPPFAAYLVANLMEDARPDNPDGSPQQELYTSYDGFPLVMRFLSSIYDTLVIVIAFGIGYQLRGKWTGVLAAWLYAGAVLPIQLAHFATADPMTGLWVALALYGAMRAQANGRMWEYGLFGIAFGAALASRFNVFPLVLSIMAVTAVRMLPAFDNGLPTGERNRILIREFGGLVLAGICTIIVFRVTNPYAFNGPGLFGIVPNSRWLDDLSAARHQTSSASDSPPQWQWVGRQPYLYPLSNMILWGMGIALGFAGWIATVWAGVRIVRGKPRALVTLPLVLWIVVYFGWVGGNFVTSMRYFLPLYAAFAALAAYGLAGLVEWANARRGSSSGRTVRRVLAWGALAGVTAFTIFWAAAFTNIYRHQATFTQVGHWVWEQLPADFAMKLDGAPEGTPWLNIALNNSNGRQNEPITNATQIHSGFEHWLDFTPAQSGTISQIYTPHLGSLSPNSGSSSLRLWITRADEPTPMQIELGEEPIHSTLIEAVLTDDFAYDPDRIGRSYTIPLDPPLQVEAGQKYRFHAQMLDGGPLVSSGALATWEGSWDEVVPPQVCTLPLGVTLADDPPPGLLSPLDCNKRNTWYSILNGYEMELYAEDEEWKREHMLRALDNTEYLIIGTNRRYDSQNRIPLRWPLTNAYYDALFSGELGYELVEVFHETFELGPIQISDQYLPIYDAPEWLNEFEAEEAFHVYDHPAVLVYKRGENYDPAKARDILNSVSLVRPPSRSDAGHFTDPTLLGPVVWNVETAHSAPTQLMLSPDAWDIQTNGGTWSERFDRESLLNRQPLIGAFAWYGLVWLIGMSIWPLLWRAMPGLSDRGYGLSRTAGVLIVAFIAWVLASLHIAVWNGAGLWLIMIALGLVSGVVAYRGRAELGTFVRANRRLLLTTEAAFGVLFALMLFVRATNPDLWTIGYGGEKPMDVAYFNGVLRSTVFPPLDPWHAGGFINYYYFGYVFVGVPTLMSGIMTAIAYNLILPMLFAMTGVGAFSLAYSLVDKWRVKLPASRDQQPAADEKPKTEGLKPKASVKRPLGNAYLAGIAALMMAVLLGNLDTPRTALRGLANMGGYNDRVTMLDFLTEQHREQTGEAPNNDQMVELMNRAQDPSIGDNVRFQLDIAADQWRSIFEGLRQMVQERKPLDVSPNRWFWAASRVTAEALDNNDITEMPYFTFIYGDLHAHMISMPLMMFAIGFVMNEVLLAGRESRRARWRWVALIFGAICIGLFRAVNTWEWPTFTVLGLLGLGYAWWLRWRRIDRWSLLDILMTNGGLMVIGYLAAKPYTQWYAANYNSIKLWDGKQTPLWAYLDIHGLFLFVIVSLLVWETVRWLRSVKVRALRGKLWMLLGGFLIFIGLIVGSIAAAIADYQVALIVVPLVAWIAVLFFRPGQHAVMQFVLVIIGLGLALTLAVEVIVLEGDVGRANTIFKFYMQVWLFFSVAAGAGVAWLLEGSRRWRGGLFYVWYGLGSLLFIAAALFPVMATIGKAGYRLAAEEVGLTLDGSLFMRETRDYWEGEMPDTIDMALDYAAINWLQDNVQGSPVIIEGRSPQEEYYWGGRIAIHTGLPTVQGWNFHQRQQRTLPQLGDLVYQRVYNINYFYSTPDSAEAWRILDHYDVEYIVVAGLERARYGQTNALDKFDLMVSDGWLKPELVVDGQTLIYRVLEENGPDMSSTVAMN